jgi:hypothetical protein
MGWQEDQKAVATGVTDGTIRYRDAFPKDYDFASINAAFDKEYAIHKRNEVLEEVALQFDMMPALGDTSASFAAFVRGMKR